MSDSNQPQTSWIYEGIWGLLTNLFCVPRNAPELPTMAGEEIVTCKPAAAFVRYLKFQFFLTWGFICGALLLGVVILVAASANPIFFGLGVVVMVPLVILIMIGFVAIYLRYDTTWYIFSDRSMRLRRGLWLINESTITFENIQNVKVTQGPLQRYFGIANVVVETAGGGGAQPEAGGGLGMHAGLIEGVSDTAEIRDSIMSRVKVTNTTGLGDEFSDQRAPSGNWSPQHIAVLREIRDLARRASATE